MTRDRTPDQRNPRERVAQRSILLIGALALVGMIAISAGLLLQPAPLADADDVGGPLERSSQPDARDEIWFGMNDALRGGDRAAFLSYAVGDAQDALAHWWDNTEQMGRTTAAITPKWASEDGAQATVILGAQLPFAPQTPRGSGDHDAGLTQIQGAYYSVELTGQGADRRISQITAASSPEPWDQGELHVQRRDNVVLFSQNDESALVDEQIDAAQRGAERALALLDELGGTSPVDGFVIAVTSDADRFRRWQFGEDEPWAMNVSAFARPMVRPDVAQRWLEADVAVGTMRTSGTVIVLGPRGLRNAERNLVHEYAHAMLNAAYPSLRASAPASVTEGFARYLEWYSGMTEPAFTEPAVRSAIANRGAEAFSTSQLRGEKSWIGYAAAGSYYAFVADTGGDVWELALDARSDADGLVGFARRHPQFSLTAWQGWIAQQ